MSLLDRFGLARSTARVGPLGPRHALRLAEIHAAAFARPWTAEEFDGFLLDRSVRIDGLFLGRDPQPAGFVLSRMTLDEAEILSVALARWARGRGEARRLLLHHLQALAHAGVRDVHLEVEEGNDPALALYRRLGFVQTGHRPGYYARPDGTRASALSMTLRLAPEEAGSVP
ncbi:GNAT family N-acetyltransferase [Enterovirga aerilata]|uniref:GNAT family N-acetyltransferase n=1 Tax=Enterovirga aerilata TaxID=2730920 RepID=A0A849IEC3_9HYPH|nr:GNAT family N-acetyltransferase [Enterovirga sp. DB1703]